MDDRHATVQAIRPLVPAKDFTVSKAFYCTLGFELRHDGDEIALFAMDDATFFLQNFHAPGLAENFVVQLVVADVEACGWVKIEALDLVAPLQRCGAPLSPRAMAWGARVLFLFDPSGVLWHVSQYDGA